MIYVAIHITNPCVDDFVEYHALDMEYVTENLVLIREKILDIAANMHESFKNAFWNGSEDEFYDEASCRYNFVSEEEFYEFSGEM